jgi:hypothetical protein
MKQRLEALDSARMEVSSMNLEEIFISFVSG